MIRLFLALVMFLPTIGCKSAPKQQPLAVPFRVLILGDSISIGYTPHVQEALAGRAIVERPTMAHRTGDSTKKGAENCAGTNNGVQHLSRWLAIDGGNWDLIHFNFGLHDLKRVQPGSGKNSNDATHPYQASPEVYEAQLRAIAQQLKDTGARVIFATTTPVPKGDLRPYRSPEDPLLYNTIARRVMAELDVPVNDLFAFVESFSKPILKPANVHFTSEGSQALAGQVAKRILSVAGIAADS
ncbi:MAG: SGNH/GDSL hydrolase family protein [Planctomycetota bacterium]